MKASPDAPFKRRYYEASFPPSVGKAIEKLSKETGFAEEKQSYLREKKKGLKNLSKDVRQMKKFI